MFIDQNKMRFSSLSNVQFGDLRGYFLNIEEQQRTTIFHYAGHAGGTNVSLTNGTLHMEAFGELLTKLPNLQLVFLNGCDTREVAGILLNKGIKAVIVTEGPVNDVVATDFAVYFYQAYYNLNTLADSFEYAKNCVLSVHEKGDLTFSRVVRGLDDDISDAKNRYSLHVIDEACLRNNMLFQLPYEMEVDDNIEYEPCRELVRSMAESILEGNYSENRILTPNEQEEFNRLYTDLMADDTDPRTVRLLCNGIIKHMPFPIGWHLSNLWGAGKMAAQEGLYLELLQQQLATYNASIQLLSFSMLNCFLDELMKRGGMELTDGQWDVMQNFMDSGEPNNALINSPALLVTIRSVFEQVKVEPFITEYQELREVFREGEDSFQSTHLFIQGLKASLQNGEIKKLDVKSLCKRVENILVSIFAKAGFLIRYKLTTVKDIEYNQSRRMPQPSYGIRRIILDGADVDGDYRGRYTNPLHTYSVVFAREINRNSFNGFMNLSPFIIDENGLKGENAANLYFYSHSEGEDYVYRRSENMNETRTIKKVNTYQPKELKGKPDPLIKQINGRMTELKGDLDFFKLLIHNRGVCQTLISH